MSFSAGFYLFLIVLVSCSGPSFFAQNEENILVNASVTDLGDGAISATIEVSKSVSQKFLLQIQIPHSMEPVLFSLQDP